jgi:hypothetical protein
VRKVITIENKPFTFDDRVKQEIQEIITLLDAYLEEYRAQGTSKYAVMKPVAKTLQRAQTGQWLTDSLTGYALRIHEMRPKTGGYISPEATQKLEDGVRRLVAFLGSIPVTAIPKVIEQIDYGVYFERQRKSIKARAEWQEAMKGELAGFLHTKYASDADFAQAWNYERFTTMNNLPYYFGPSSETYKKAKGQMKADMDEFYEFLTKKGQTPEAGEAAQ